MKFMSDDGKVFDTMEECEKYEKECKAVGENVYFLKTVGTDFIEIPNPLHADYVVIKGKFDSKATEELFDSFDVYCDGLDGVGAYYWDDDKEKWIKISHRICELEEEMDEIKDTIELYENLVLKIKLKINF